VGAKKIKKRRFVRGVTRVSRALRAIAATTRHDVPADGAPVPIWELTGPVPSGDAPVPAIRPELVDPVIIITDPYVVADFEATGLHMARILDPDYEKVLLLLIDTSRDLDGRQIDAEFAIDMGPEIRDRTIGRTLARLAAKGRLRIIATGDESRVIVQMIFRPEDDESAELNEAVEYWMNRKRQ
jgi:hypothetical protein